MSDADIQSAAETALGDSIANDVTSYKIGNREVKRERDPTKTLDAILKLRGLQSPRRGMNLGQIDRPA